MMPGRQTLDAVWRTQLLSGLEATKDRQAVEVMWDIRKCYENVNHAALADEARIQGYPMSLLRLSLSSYRWKRQVVGMGGLLADPVYPAAGIVAGSSMATYEIALYMQRKLGDILAESSATFSLHIDDLSVGVTGASVTEVIGVLAPVLASVRCALMELGLPVAEAKSQVLCSSLAMEQEMLRHLGKWAGKVADTARRLGVDHQLRQVRIRPVRANRAKVYLTRKHVLKQLGKQGAKARVKVFQAGLLPAFLFGTELDIPNLGTLQKLRTDCIGVHGLKQTGVATALSLLALPAAQDPKCKALEAGIVRWHREIWYNQVVHPSHPDAIHPGVLEKALRQAQSEEPQQ